MGVLPKTEEMADFMRDGVGEEGGELPMRAAAHLVDPGRPHGDEPAACPIGFGKAENLQICTAGLHVAPIDEPEQDVTAAGHVAAGFVEQAGSYAALDPNEIDRRGSEDGGEVTAGVFADARGEGKEVMNEDGEFQVEEEEQKGRHGNLGFPYRPRLLCRQATRDRHQA